LLSEDASQVVVPGTEGDFTVLAGHAPVISTIRPGVVEASLADSRTLRLFIKGGFAEVDANRLIVLAQRALEVDSLDASLLAAELETAESELAAAADDSQRFAAHAAVDQLRALQAR
jgi:F-type H+-transporting ATPase subunit epsilon